MKLLDFGLAKHFPSVGGDGQTTDDLTNLGAVAGTIHYMSPEQLAGTRRSTIDATSSRSAPCSIRWRQAPGRSISSREAR